MKARKLESTNTEAGSRFGFSSFRAFVTHPHPFDLLARKSFRLHEPRNRLQRFRQPRSRTQELVFLVSIDATVADRGQRGETAPERQRPARTGAFLVAHRGVDNHLRRRGNHELHTEMRPAGPALFAEIDA